VSVLHSILPAATRPEVQTRETACIFRTAFLASNESALSVQYDLFPERVLIEQLDPRAIAGPQTRIVSMFVVRFERESAVHQVFVDHHGIYCADHGRDCRAVGEAARFSRGVKQTSSVKK